MSKQRFNRNVPITFHTEADEPDVTYKDGQIYIQGETLKKLKRLAKEAGVSPGAYLNKRLREAMRDPDWLEKVIAEQARELRRLSSWCDRRGMSL
jgi:hypothetical protein